MLSPCQAIAYLIKLYGAEAQEKTNTYSEPKGISLEVTDSVKEMCEWRLGREKLKVEDELGQITEVAAEEMELQKLKPSEIVTCLKKIQSSVALPRLSKKYQWQFLIHPLYSS